MYQISKATMPSLHLLVELLESFAQKLDTAANTMEETDGGRCCIYGTVRKGNLCGDTSSHKDVLRQK